MNIIKNYLACAILLTMVALGQVDQSVSIQAQIIGMYSHFQFWEIAALLLIIAKFFDFCFRGVDLGDVADKLFRKKTTAKLDSIAPGQSGTGA